MFICITMVFELISLLANHKIPGIETILVGKGFLSIIICFGFGNKKTIKYVSSSSFPR